MYIYIYTYVYIYVCLWENLYLGHQKIMRESLNTWLYLNKIAFVQPKHMNVNTFRFKNEYIYIYTYISKCVPMGKRLLRTSEYYLRISLQVAIFPQKCVCSTKSFEC